MTKIIGHRGGRNVWAENSRTGFEKTRDLAIDGVEFDVHLTDAGELLVIHDATLDRTTVETGRVSALPLGAARSVHLKGTSEGIPTLDDVLEIYAGTKVELHIELKDDANGVPYPGIVEAVLAAVDRFDLRKQSFLTSFTTSILADIRRAAPDVRTLSSLHAPLVEGEGLQNALKARLAVADVIAIENAVLKTHWTEITGMVSLDRLGGWVPNSEDDLRYWLSLGLRQITTDEPIRALALQGKTDR